MSAPVPTTWRTPPAAELDAGLPVFGRTLTTLAGALNHLQGWHCRGFAAADVWQGPAGTYGASTDLGYITGQPEAHGTVIMPYYVPIGVEWVHLVMFVLSLPATPDGGATTPTVTVTVESASGVARDDGCIWTRADGSLPGDHHWTRGRTRLLLPVQVETGSDRADDPTPGTPDTPRRLYVGDDVGGVAIIKAVTVRARIVAMHIIPEPLVTL